MQDKFPDVTILVSFRKISSVTDRTGLNSVLKPGARPYLHKAPDVLLFLEEVLVEPAPVGHKMQHFAFPEQSVLSLLLAPAASTAIGESG